MVKIISAENGRIKEICRLTEKKYRTRYGKFMIEGYRNVKDSLPYLSHAEIYVAESALQKYCSEFNVDFVCADAAFAKMSDTKNSQGIICVADICAKALDFSKNCIFLDGVSDPGNLGTILRSCVATGCSNVIIRGGVDCYNPKVVRSSMSAVSMLNIIESRETDILSQLKGEGYKIICADMKGQNLFDIRAEIDKFCLIVGAEADGVSSEVMDLADIVVCLPMENIESLNVAVCASIMMYQLKFRKNGG